MPSPNRPLPAPDDLSRPFWDGAAAGQLVIQRCDDCGYYNHPPRPLCDRCASAALSFTPVSDRGTVYSYTINHQKNVAGFEEAAPYGNLMVELEEQPLLILISDLPGEEAHGVRIGEPVQVCFEPLPDGLALPRFVRAGQRGGETHVGG